MNIITDLFLKCERLLCVVSDTQWGAAILLWWIQCTSQENGHSPLGMHCFIFKLWELKDLLQISQENVCSQPHICWQDLRFFCVLNNREGCTYFLVVNITHITGKSAPPHPPRYTCSNVFISLHLLNYLCHISPGQGWSLPCMSQRPFSSLEKKWVEYWSKI
jgi:hypothetical protein